MAGPARLNWRESDIALAVADERTDNAPGVKKAGHKLASDAVAAATLALASGGAVSAVPQLEAGGSAITAFATAVAKCKSA